MQAGHNGLKHLHDDGARDVGHNAQGEDGHVRERTAREKIQQGHRTAGEGIASGLEKARHRLEGDAGHGNVRTDTVHNEHRDGKKNLSAEFFDAEGVLQTS